jgi:hypothetical protein
MAYIGTKPTIGNFQICDAISVVNGQAAYTMQVGGVNVSPQSASHMIVSLNGTIQKPNSSFTVSGSTITFASNLATGDVIDFIQILGDVLDLGVPSDATVTTAKLADSSVSLAKLTATGTKSSSTFLRGDNTFAEVVSGLTMADQFRLTADYTFSSPGALTANLERVDGTNQGTLGTGMSESSGVFTFPSTGIYLVRFSAQQYKNGDRRDIQINIETTSNNSSYANIAECITHITQSASNTTYIQGMTETILDITDTSNQKVRFAVFTDATTAGSSTKNKTFMTFIRLGDT